MAAGVFGNASSSIAGLELPKSTIDSSSARVGRRHPDPRPAQCSLASWKVNVLLDTVRRHSSPVRESLTVAVEPLPFTANGEGEGESSGRQSGKRPTHV